ncbi:hypothetical protein K435DRAFT_880844 [Dendrothele bispora CBS 962.96]|uniref:Uncharacterized protein n=1 Tax=Dendrothele bispora (strain CBS 962.96) TaxID=1314807 RepID=A0A4S8KJ19_DENBC|nr:hypothetical protein K435DRAFT_880844 [Dendrothele bispora CBS 962.96]
MLMPSRCHSLTFQYAGTKHPSDLFVQEHYYEHSLIGSSVLAMLQCLTPPLPLLSTSVVQISSLSIHFHYSSIPPSIIEQEFLLDETDTEVRGDLLEGLKELRLFGCSVGVVRDMVQACPAIVALEPRLEVLSESSSSSSTPSNQSRPKSKYISNIPLHLLPIRLVLARQRAIDKFYAKREAREIHLEAQRQIA